MLKARTGIHRWRGASLVATLLTVAAGLLGLLQAAPASADWTAASVTASTFTPTIGQTVTATLTSQNWNPMPANTLVRFSVGTTQVCQVTTSAPSSSQASCSFPWEGPNGQVLKATATNTLSTFQNISASSLYQTFQGTGTPVPASVNASIAYGQPGTFQVPPFKGGSASDITFSNPTVIAGAASDVSITSAGLLSLTPTASANWVMQIAVTETVTSGPNTGLTVQVVVKVLTPGGTDLTLPSWYFHNQAVAVQLPNLPAGHSPFYYSIVTPLPKAVEEADVSPSGVLTFAPSGLQTGTFTLAVLETLSPGPLSVGSKIYVHFTAGYGSVGVPLSNQLSTPIGQAPGGTFLFQGGEPVPPGLTLSTTGLLSGTPQQPGYSVPTVAYWVHGHTTLFTLPISINPGCAVAMDDAHSNNTVRCPGAPAGAGLLPNQPVTVQIPVIPGHPGREWSTRVYNCTPNCANVSVTQNGLLTFTPTLQPIQLPPGVLPEMDVWVDEGTQYEDWWNVTYSVADPKVGSPLLIEVMPPTGQSAGSFTLAPGSALPPGLSISATGLISGTPTEAGTWNTVLTYRIATLTNTPTTIPATITVAPS
jgi:hypothetical protein